MIRLRGFIQQLPLRLDEARIGKQNTNFAPIFVCKQNGFLRKFAGTAGTKFQELGMGAGRNALTIEKVGGPTIVLLYFGVSVFVFRQKWDKLQDQVSLYKSWVGHPGFSLVSGFGANTSLFSNL